MAPLSLAIEFLWEADKTNTLLPKLTPILMIWKQREKESLVKEHICVCAHMRVIK